MAFAPCCLLRLPEVWGIVEDAGDLMPDRAVRLMTPSFTIVYNPSSTERTHAALKTGKLEHILSLRVYRGSYSGQRADKTYFRNLNCACTETVRQTTVSHSVTAVRVISGWVMDHYGSNLKNTVNREKK